MIPLLRTVAAVALLGTSMPAFAEAPPPSHPAVKPEAPPVTFHRLELGNLRFTKGVARHPAQTIAVRNALANEQHPHAIVVACSDSRVAPELVFDQGLGELFVVREAGNELEPLALASIEYGVAHLGVRLIVIMGHESCGAVKTGLAIPDGQSAGSPNLDALVSSVKSNLSDAGLTDADRHDPKVVKAAHANVDAVTRQLTQRSELLKARVDAGELAVVSAIYSLDTGHVEFWHTEGLLPAAPISEVKAGH
ncbi:carbonic anhydrase [Corallococcus sp. CA053C]|uniref:carbonic anhydrase n=1 Tax=Corallococcus sp. CA053C TaxID=2316732 RepID=UPI000EA324D2|nr:carbonic anhydrase [Corallococcus sp. CA053C]RKH09528.1 carbonic anhydrase [Corallococcus sp. CA053C]